MRDENEMAASLRAAIARAEAAERERDEWMREAKRTLGHYTGRVVTARVTYMTPGGWFGLPGDICVMSIEPAHHDEQSKEGM